MTLQQIDLNQRPWLMPCDSFAMSLNLANFSFHRPHHHGHPAQ